MLNLPRILGILVLASLPIGAQNKSAFGWDLSYKSVLGRNNVAQSDWIWKWLERYKSPAETWITNWRGEPIVSSILVEYPAFHAGESTTMWFVRTSGGAHYWESIEGREKDDSEETIKPELYDALFKHASSWRQLEPKPQNETPKDVLPGYIGFVSLFDKDSSKQMLLTMEDFLICLDKSCLPGKLKAGRLLAAIEPIISPEDTYKHKSEALIARMTPSERIDEEIKEADHLFETPDTQMRLIRKYRVADGLKGSNRLIELIDGYNPKSSKDTRFFRALMIAQEIDDRTVRLRASAEGRQIIDAAERLSIRLLSVGKQDDVVKIALESIKSVNDADRAILETLWVKYRIKISDSELLEFSNYLVKHDPTYPSWSEIDFIKDFSRINEAGNPAQVYVMKKPERYYLIYKNFQGLSGKH